MSRWIDVQLAAMGYLRSPEGRWRHIPGLDVIARDTLQLGIRVRWGRPPGGEPACAFWRDGEIIMVPEIFEHEPYVVKDVWTHELVHCACGPCCKRTREIQERVYGELVYPAFV